MFNTNTPRTATTRASKGASIAAIALLGSTALAACGGSDSSSSGSSASNVGKGQAVKVGAYAFPEGQLLGNLYATALNDAGFKATVVQTQGRETGQPALSQKSIDVVPEYTSSLLDYYKAKSSGSDDAKNYTLLKSEAEKKGVSILAKAPATDNYAFGVLTDFAKKNNLTTLSDLAKYSESKPVAVAGIQECQVRSYCLAGLKSQYGLKVSSFKVTVLASQASVDLLKKDEVQLVQFDSSDGILSSNPITILKDDKSLNHNDYIVPAVNTKALTPEMQKVLDNISSKLTQEKLNEANKAVQVDRVPAADAAKDLYKKLAG